MGDETLELASTGRSKCRTCKEPIAKDTWRLAIATPGQFDGDMIANHHAICGVIRKPTGFLRALSANRKVPKDLREAYRAIGNATLGKRLVQVVWRHAIEPRCLLEFSSDRYVLITKVKQQVLTTEGTLDEMIASVPDEDLEEVVDAATAAGKTVGKSKPAENPKKSAATVQRQVFHYKKNAKGDQAREIILDETKLRVSQGIEGGPFKHKKFATAALAAKYFRYVISNMTWTKVVGDVVALDPDEDFKDVKDKSSDYRYLENKKAKQFWDIDRDSSELHITHGAIGSAGAAHEEVCDWDGDAKRRWKELVDEKFADGYIEPPGYAARRAAGNK